MNGDIQITNAKYIQTLNNVVIGVFCLFGGETVVAPIDPANRHYAEILRQVADGTLTIADAD